MRHIWSAIVAVVAVAILSGNGQARPFNDPRSERNDAIDQAAATGSADPACHARMLVSTGGSMPNNPHTLAVRWIGYSNFELVYNGHILLLDAYYDRGGVAAAYPGRGCMGTGLRQGCADIHSLPEGDPVHMGSDCDVLSCIVLNHGGAI